MTDISLRIVSTFTDGASGLVARMASNMTGAMSRFAPAAIGASLALAAIVAALGYSVVQAANFQQGLNRLVTGAGDVTDNMQKMGQSILQTSVDSGVLTDKLLPAMYQIISAGQRGAQAENTLAVAAKGSVVEQANVVDVAKALTTAMTDYGTKVYNATQFMNGYTRATQLGKITLEELSKTMGPILPLAQNIGIKFADVAAAMSTMTNAGIPAARAATSLRFLFQSLENPTAKAGKAMVKFGLDSVKLGNELKVSLPGALQMVWDAAKRAGPEGSVPFNRAVSDMIGGQRSLQAYLALTGTHMQTFAGNTKAISAAMNASKTVVLGWDVAQTNFNVQLGRAHAALNMLAITIGNLLLPVLTKIVSAVTPIITAFAKWISTGDNAKTALAILGGVIGGLAAIILAVAVPALIAMIATMWPILLVGAAVGAAIFGIILAIQHWGQITKWIGDVWKTVSTTIGSWVSWLGSLIHTVLGDIGAWVGNVFSAIGTTVRNALTGIKNFVGGVFSAIGTFIRDRLTWIKNTVGSIFSAIGTTITNFKNLVGSVFSAIGTTIGSFFTWLYNHNYYVKAFCDLVVKDFTALKTGVAAAFSAMGTFIRDRLTWINNSVGWFFSQVGGKFHAGLTWIKNEVGNFFSMIGAAFQAGLTWIKNLVGNFFDMIGTAIHDKLTGAKNDAGTIFDNFGTMVQGKLTDFKNAVGQKFDQLGTMMHQKLTDAWNGLVKLASGWPAQALQWGINLIQGLINGIGQKVGDLFSMLGGIANKIKGILGFHSPPKEGPMRDADTWMPNMMRMFTSGIVAGSPSLQRALNNALAPVGASMAAPVGAASRAGSSGAGSGGVVVNNFNVTVNAPALSRRDAATLADALNKQLAQTYRSQNSRAHSGVR